MSELKDNMDELETISVLARPEDVNVVVEYVFPAFSFRNSVVAIVSSLRSIALEAIPKLHHH